jgi:hypothetical protein
LSKKEHEENEQAKNKEEEDIELYQLYKLCFFLSVFTLTFVINDFPFFYRAIRLSLMEDDERNHIERNEESSQVSQETLRMIEEMEKSTTSSTITATKQTETSTIEINSKDSLKQNENASPKPHKDRRKMKQFEPNENDDDNSYDSLTDASEGAYPLK